MSKEKEKEKPINIYQRINSVMKEVTYIQKGEKRVNNQYRFISHDQVSGIMHKALTEHGIVMVPTVKEYKIDGNRTEVLVNVRFVNVDDPADFVVVDYLGFGIDASDKGPGKAISYACKYALLKVFCLETGDDPDQDQDTKHDPEEKPTITQKQAQEIRDLIAQCTPGFRDNFINGLISRYKEPAYTKIPAHTYIETRNMIVTHLENLNTEKEEKTA